VHALAAELRRGPGDEIKTKEDLQLGLKQTCDSWSSCVWKKEEARYETRRRDAAANTAKAGRGRMRVKVVVVASRYGKWSMACRICRICRMLMRRMEGGSQVQIIAATKVR